MQPKYYLYNSKLGKYKAHSRKQDFGIGSTANAILNKPPHTFKTLRLYGGGELNKDLNELRKMLPNRDYSRGIDERDFILAINKGLSEAVKGKVDIVGGFDALDAMPGLKDAPSLAEFIVVNKPIIERRNAEHEAIRGDSTLAIFRNFVAAKKAIQARYAPSIIETGPGGVSGQQLTTSKSNLKVIEIPPKAIPTSVKIDRLPSRPKLKYNEMLTKKQIPLEENPRFNRKADLLHRFDVQGGRRNEELAKRSLEDAIQKDKTRLKNKQKLFAKKFGGNLDIDLSDSDSDSEVDDTLAPITSAIIQRLFILEPNMYKPPALFLQGLEDILNCVVHTVIAENDLFDSVATGGTVDDLVVEVFEAIDQGIEEYDILNKAIQSTVDIIEKKLNVKFTTVDIDIIDEYIRYIEHLKSCIENLIRDTE